MPPHTASKAVSLQDSPLQPSAQARPPLRIHSHRCAAVEGRAQGPFESSVVSGARKAQQQIQIHREPASTFGKAQPSLQVPHFHICKQGNSTWQRGLSQEWGEAVKSQHSPGAEGCSRKAGQTTVKEPCKVCREHRYEKEL